MARAPDVLREAIIEMALQANTGGSLEQLQTLANLTSKAYDAGDGELPDEDVRNGGLSAGALSRLAIGPTADGG